MASLAQSQPSPLPSLPPVPGAACQGRLAWGQPHVWRSCQRSGIPPGAKAGRVARRPLPAAGCPPRALPAPGGSRRVVVWLRGTGGPGQGTPVPRVAPLERHWCAQFLPTPVGIRCCVGLWRSHSWSWCPGTPLPTALPSQSAGDRGMGHLPKHTFPSIPMPQAPPVCHHPGPALPWHSGGQGFAWHGAGGVREPPEQGAAPPLPESPAGCGCERQVQAGERCLEFVSRSRERQEQILIINNPAGWRLCWWREGAR